MTFAVHIRLNGAPTPCQPQDGGLPDHRHRPQALFANPADGLMTVFRNWLTPNRCCWPPSTTFAGRHPWRRRPG